MLEVLVLAAAVVTDCGFEGSVYARGVASEPDSGRLLYCEYHLPAQGEQRKVLYYSPQGFRIGEKVLSGIDTPLPEVLQQDFRHGEMRAARRTGGQWELIYRERGGEQSGVEKLSPGQVDVIDAGFDKLVREHWESLARGDSVSFRFASPLHGRAITLRAQRHNCADGMQDALCLRVDLAQPILRLFAGQLNLVYDRSSRRLRVFEGVSNLLNARGESQRVHIGYTYPE